MWNIVRGIGELSQSAKHTRKKQEKTNNKQASKSKGDGLVLGPMCPVVSRGRWG